jgi:hypothetical protein
MLVNCDQGLLTFLSFVPEVDVVRNLDQPWNEELIPRVVTFTTSESILEIVWNSRVVQRIAVQVKRMIVLTHSFWAQMNVIEGEPCGPKPGSEYTSI